MASVRHAIYGSLEGEAAVAEIFRWRQGRFYFEEGIISQVQTVDRPWTHLLIDNLQKLDETLQLVSVQAEAMRDTHTGNAASAAHSASGELEEAPRLHHLRARQIEADHLRRTGTAVHRDSRPSSCRKPSMFLAELDLVPELSGKAMNVLAARGFDSRSSRTLERRNAAAGGGLERGLYQDRRCPGATESRGANSSAAESVYDII